MKFGLVMVTALAAMMTLGIIGGADPNPNPDCSGQVIPVGGAAATVYVIIDHGGAGTWLYLESNGIDGLQRGQVGITQPVWDATGDAVLTDDDTSCCDIDASGACLTNLDTLIF